MLPLILQFFGPAITSLLDSLVKRAKAGWEVSAMKAGASVAGAELLAQAMGCDLGLLTPALMAIPAAILMIFEVPANMVMPTIMQAMQAAIEQKKRSDAVLADAEAKQEEARKKYGIQSIGLVLCAGLVAGCSLEQVQKTQDVLVRLRADAQTVAIVGCAHLPYAQSTIPAILALLPPGTDKDKLINGVTLASDLAAEFCAKVQAASTTTTIQ